MDMSELGSEYGDERSRKEVFKAYLRKSGVMNTVMQVLVGLYEEPERPDNAADAKAYFVKYLAAPNGIDLDGMREESEELRHKNAELEARIVSLKKELKEWGF
mmetsp:Transcript_59464/g.166076  ORF Transcript_59464/g.166076 Transcript_59464/m.166076 type:complete len:103 (-) Transcript_59464:652-960(-)